MSGLRIANNLLANSVQYNLNKNQDALKNVVSELSSGLRINSAADDPSGMAIATNLQTQVDAFHTAVQNVQNANNAVQVAEGALDTTTNLLQRIRDLAVEASSDVSSLSDRTNLQAEVSQLLLEINRISQSTTFNGQALLDGSRAGFQQGQDAFLNVTSNAVLASNGAIPTVNGVDNGSLIASISGVSVAGVNYFNTTPNAALPGIQGIGNGEATVDGTLKLEVVNTGASIAVTETFIESDTGYVTVSTGLFGPSNAISGNVVGDSSGGFDNVAITIGQITEADVGLTAYVKISQNVAASSSASGPLTVQSGANEGDTVQLSLQATNTQTLRIANINLALTSSVEPTLGAEDAVGQVTNALNTVLSQRAALGAMMVRLNEDADNAGIAGVNMQSSESAIRDLDIGHATSEFTRLQVLVQVGTSVLAQSDQNANSVLGLFR